MSDPVTNQTPAPEAQSVVAPQAAEPPVTPKSAAPKVQPKQTPKKGGNPEFIKIPTNAFKARVQREAAVEIKRRLGCTMEEALAKIQAAPLTQGQQTSANATADAVVTQVRTENERLRKQVQKADTENKTTVKKLQRQLNRERDGRLEAELRAEARVAGITDTDYASHLFSKALLAGQEVTPEAFFNGLKKTHPFLFSANTVQQEPTEVDANTAPAESQATGEVRPSPNQPGTPPKVVNAEDMSDVEFAAHKRKYGVSGA